MAETVFILGAGASVDAGAPVMADFFDAMQRAVVAQPNPQLRRY